MSDMSDCWMNKLTEQERLRTGNPHLTLTREEAAAVLAEGLMAGDPATFKQGYTRENAVIAACEMFEITSLDTVEKTLADRSR